ncbi:GntR family transcriptional regulator [Oenococcus oeni]|uniref:GntR family transcriptional regulator n=1 Tax=Oenococcus oeni TaxID=1247 RepID=UPI00148B26D1|nr:GntR family transcriptional regulator [Oenococcus oeni]QJU69222.1 GntR family transcriptional regulator [Oenococcus oeni]
MAITQKRPIYLQLVDRIKNEVATDVLSANDQLPSVRETALQEKINPNTVTKAYKELEAQKVIRTIPGKGTFITGNTASVKNSNQNRLLADLSQVIAELIKSGVKGERIKKIVNDILGGKNAEN